MRNFIFGLFVGALIVGAATSLLIKQPAVVTAAAEGAPPTTSPFKAAGAEAFDAIATAQRFSYGAAPEYEPNHAKALEAVNKAKRAAVDKVELKGAVLLHEYLDYVQFCREMLRLGAKDGDKCNREGDAKALAAKNAIGATSWADLSPSLK